MPQTLTMVISLIGVLGLIFMMFWAIQRLNRRVSNTGGKMRVIDRVNLGRDSMLLVVSVCGKLMLVGVAAQRIEKLADLPMTEEEYANSNAGFAAQSNFADVLAGVFLKKKNPDSEAPQSQEEDRSNEDEKS